MISDKLTINMYSYSVLLNSLVDINIEVQNIEIEERIKTQVRHHR